MSDFGFKIALPGFDVKTATPEQCSLHSSYGHMKIQRPNGGLNYWSAATYVFSSNPGINTTTDLVTVTHNYGYVPANMCTMYPVTGLGGNNPIGQYATLPYGLGGTGAGNSQSFVCGSTSTAFKIQFVRGNGIADLDMTASSWTFKYYIFVENGA